MKELRSEVKSLVEIELERANAQFPMFNSDHEGISVIREEMFEATADADSMKNCIDRLENAVFLDSTLDAKWEWAIDAEREAVELACEAIQTAAMLRKFRDSHGKKAEDDSFSQEEADMLAEECPEADAMEPPYIDFSKFIEMLIARKHVEEEQKNA